MTDLFVKLYTLIKGDNYWLKKIRYYSLLRFSIRIIANLVLPCYYIATQRNRNYKIMNTYRSGERIIVSLTSFPARISRLWLVVESLLRQEVKPDMIILWLSKKQFRSVETLPSSLLRLQKRGLLIKLVDGDIRSHKKYYYSIQNYPHDIIVTVDDDVFYHSKTITYLWDAHRKRPLDICANHARCVSYKGNELLRYADFNYVRTLGEGSPYYLQIGIGGVLYPPNSLYKDIAFMDLALRLAPLADDIWLYSMARLQRRDIYRTNYKYSFLPVININNTTLSEINCGNDRNDEQIGTIREYYKRKGKDPFLKND